MRTRITFNKISETSTGVPIAECSIDLCDKMYRSNTIVRIKVNITHHAVKVTSDHTMSDLRFIAESLDEDRVRNFGIEKITAHNILQAGLQF